MTRRVPAIAVLLFCAHLAAMAQSPKVEPAGALTDSPASDLLKKAVSSKGWRVTAPGGAVCDIWLRESLPVRQKSGEAGDILYPVIAESTLVGVVSFPAATTDFRGQPLKPGVYTMRYWLLPSDGNHMGAAPQRDFLLLVPAASDQNPDATFSFQDLVKLSTKASGTNHPAVISMVPVDSIGELPGAARDDANHLIFGAKLKTAAGADLPVGIVVKGVASL